jgi:hypothetical protein
MDTALHEPAHYCLMGYHVTIGASDPEIAAQMRGILAAFRVHEDIAGPVRHYRIDRHDALWTLSIEEVARYTSGSIADALMALEWHLVTDMMAARTDAFHLHGAALRAPEGSGCILILGASGSGKTTLTLALIARGFAPYTDDIILINPETLAPQTFRRAFHVDARTLALVERLPTCHPWEFDALPPGYLLPLSWAEDKIPVRTIFFPTLDPNATPRVRRLSMPDAAAALLPFSTTLERNPAFALRVTARLTRYAACYALTTGDLDGTAALVAQVTAEHAISSASHPQPDE